MSVNTAIINNNKILLLLLEEEQEEDELLYNVKYKKREKVDELFLNRKSEGYFEILINRHLQRNETKFREFFRVNKNQFDFLLSLIEVQLTKMPSNRVKEPITAAEKLALTLRYLRLSIFF